MKIYQFLLLLISILSIESYSQSKKSSHPFPGITNWEKTIKKASKENKIIMVDLSTEWCTWCKSMEKNQFADSEILSLMRSKLHSYILDAEKDSIGQLLKLKYGVASYPSFLFFTPSGDYIETWTGAMPKEYWMQHIKDSIDQVPITRPGIPSGLSFKWPDFVVKELKVHFKNSKPSDPELSSFFSNCNYRKFEDFNVCRFYPLNIPDSLLSKMFSDKKWLDDNYGPDVTQDFLSTSINWKAYKQIQDSNWNEAYNYINIYATNFQQLDWDLFNLKLFYFKSKIEVDSLIQLGLKYPSFVDDNIAAELIEFIYVNGKTKAHFKQAVEWNKSELKKYINFKLAKYQSQFFYKLSEITEAKKWAIIALDKAKIEGIQVSNDDELNKIINYTNEKSREGKNHKISSERTSKK